MVEYAKSIMLSDGTIVRPCEGQTLQRSEGRGRWELWQHEPELRRLRAWNCKSLLWLVPVEAEGS